MKVFYFSGVGNSKSVATAIDANAINIAEQGCSTFSDDSVGFVFPVYCGGMPKMMERFIKSSTFECDYFWAVATCGGNQGNALADLNNLLRQKCKSLSYGAEIVLPDSCIVFATSEAEKQKQLAQEPTIVERIKSDVQNKAVSKIKTTFLSKLSEGVTWWGFRTFYGLDKKKAEGCVGCGLCQKNCPTQNIVVKENKVSFGNNCEYCFSCIQRCPARAITFGKLKITDKTHYQHD